MYSKDSYTLQERVEALMLNLAYSCSLFTTPKGRKAYAHSLLVEIQNVILYVNDAIDVIQSNTELFPVAPVFYMNFSALKKEVKDALREQRNNPCLTEQHFKALKELSTRLEEARSKLNGPDLCQMVSCYEKVWNRFYMKWPDMLHEVEVQTLAGMPPKPDSRRRILNHATEETFTQLKNNPVTHALYDDDILLDDISTNGHLIPEVIAPSLYKHRIELRENACVYDFFRLFMTYQRFRDELDKLSAYTADDAQRQLEKWWLGLADKVHEEVRPEYHDRFHTLALGLCHQPDLAQAFMKGTLNEPFNLKLAYNLFGVMNNNNVFTTSVVSTLRKRFSEKRVDEYFKAYLYTAYGSYTSELNETLLAVAQHIIDEWKQ